MADNNINAILAEGIGPTLLQASHSNYYNALTTRENDRERRRLAAQADIPAAMKGDTDAFGRVAGADPQAAAAVAMAQRRMSDDQRALFADFA